MSSGSLLSGPHSGLTRGQPEPPGVERVSPETCVEGSLCCGHFSSSVLNSDPVTPMCASVMSSVSRIGKLLPGGREQSTEAEESSWPAGLSCAGHGIPVHAGPACGPQGPPVLATASQCMWASKCMRARLKACRALQSWPWRPSACGLSSRPAGPSSPGHNVPVHAGSLGIPRRALQSCPRQHHRVCVSGVGLPWGPASRAARAWHSSACPALVPTPGSHCASCLGGVGTDHFDVPALTLRPLTVGAQCSEKIRLQGHGLDRFCGRPPGEAALASTGPPGVLPHMDRMAPLCVRGAAGNVLLLCGLVMSQWPLQK